MDENLNKLKKKIEDFKDNNISKNIIKNNKSPNFNIAFKISIDFVASIFVSVLIGVGMDRLFATKPIFFFIFLLLGLAAAFMSIYRTILNLERNKEK